MVEDVLSHFKYRRNCTLNTSSPFIVAALVVVNEDVDDDDKEGLDGDQSGEHAG